MNYHNTIRLTPLFSPRLFIVGLLILNISCRTAKEPKTVEQPNVLILLTDQWRAQATGYAGDPNAVTPHLDQLASESINFENAISGTPVCTPYRATLLTGQRPLTNGVFMNDVQLDPDAHTMAEIFAAEGYKTGYIGKWHLDGHGRLQNVPVGPRRQGFQFWKGNECTHDYNNSVYYDNLDPTQKIWEDYDTFKQTDAALSYIKDRKEDNSPFVIVVSYGTPHAPYHTAPEKYRERFDAEKIIVRDNVPEDVAQKAKNYLAGYYAHIAAIDDMIGKIMAELKAMGQWDNTIILFTSDHGDMLGSQGAYKKQQPFEESIGVPMLLKPTATTGVKPSSKKVVINSEDVLPTLLGLSNIDIPKSVEGADYSYLIKNDEDDLNSASLIRCVQPFGQWGRKRGGREFRGLKTPKYTYTRDLNGPWLLFDNQKDPFQLKNLIDQPEYETVQKRLDDLLSQKLDENKDQFLPGPDYIKKYGYTVDATGTVPYTRYFGESALR